MAVSTNLRRTLAFFGVSLFAIFSYTLLHLVGPQLPEWHNGWSQRATAPTTTTTQAPHPVQPQQQNLSESDEFLLYLNARRLVHLATARLNNLVQLQMNHLKLNSTTPTPCARWWSNPLEIRRFQLLNHTTSDSSFTNYELEFTAQSPYERADFSVVARVDLKPPHEVHFLNDVFARVRPPFQNYLFGPGGRFASLYRCLTPQHLNGSTLSAAAVAQLQDLCSCDHDPDKTTGLHELSTWPSNSSFLVGDYLPFHNYSAMFNILPLNRSGHCGDSVKLLVMVCSAPAHADLRLAIRDTYGSKAHLARNNASLVFLCGRVQNETLQKEIEKEATTYEDLIQANFMDSYHNLTLNRLSMYAYVHWTCSKTVYNPPTWIYRADDDYLLNLEVVNSLAERHPDVELFGGSVCGTSPVREKGKYYTPRYMYIGDIYPGYLSGGVGMIRGNILPRLIAAAQSVPLLHMEDVYSNGLLPAALSIYPRHSPVITYVRLDPENGCDLHRMANSWVHNATDMRFLWGKRQQFETALELFEAAQAKNGIVAPFVSMPAVLSIVGKCTTTQPAVQLQLEVVDEGFKKKCRYFT